MAKVHNGFFRIKLATLQLPQIVESGSNCKKLIEIQIARKKLQP
jgi:hypothetical protein